ncbi:MAG: Fic family protein [Pseudomonadota bacterium]
MSDDDRVRHSVAEEAALVTSADEIARKEAYNSLVQAKRMNEVILGALHGDRPFRVRPSLFLDLNRLAIDGLSAYAGLWRPAAVKIQDSKHTPPGAHLVPELVEQMCDYLNDSWASRTAVHLAAFTMWRTNWIHPFSDGNGRTARAVSNVVLSVRVGYFLPGSPTIPEQIVANRAPYYKALEEADGTFESKGFCDEVVSELEELLASLLARQLTSAFNNAVGDS